MKQVNIYTASTIRGPRRRSGRIGYVLEYIPENGDKATAGKIELVEDMTEQQAALTVINHALKRITEGCQIRIFTECEAILTSYKSYLPGWIKNDWKNAKGQPVKNSAEWQEMLNLLNGKPYDIEKGAHEYRKWLLAEIEREECNDTRRHKRRKFEMLGNMDEVATDLGYAAATMKEKLGFQCADKEKGRGNIDK